MARRPHVTNAADLEQTKRAARVERSRELKSLEALRLTLETPAGRWVLWDLLVRAGIYASVFHRDAGVMAFNAGKQDFGHELLALVVGNYPELYLTMEREARERDAREAAENEAAHTPNAVTEESN